MAYTTINKYSSFFNTKLYTGDGVNGRSLTGVGFQPDLTWIKCRSHAVSHALQDSVRGVGKNLKSDTDAAESTDNFLTAFNADGFTLSNSNEVNQNSRTFVSWNWKAGTTSGINTTGADITPSSYSMNATSGISIIKFTGNGTDGAKIAHGLGAVPELIISKRLENSNYWAVYHKRDNTDYLVFNAGDASSDAPIWKDTNPTSVYYQTDNSTSVNPSGETCVAYCFKSVTGFSKIGSYEGNGSSDGTFVYTGFKPAFLMVKRWSDSQGWVLWDNKRNTGNLTDKTLTGNENGIEEDRDVDFLSNGFKFQSNNTATNHSGSTYIFMAFGQSLVGTNNIACTAR